MNKKQNNKWMYKRLYLIVIFFFMYPAFSSDSLVPFMKLNAFLYNESLSIEDGLDNKDTPFNKKGDQQLGSLWFEAGIKKNKWLLSALYREEHQLNYHPDTAELYNVIENLQTLETGRTYNIELDTVRYRATGLRIARDFIISPQLQISLGSSFFRTSKLRNGSLNGIASALSEQDYDYNASVDYYYDEDVLFDRPNVKQPIGKGLSLDIASLWQVNNNIEIDLEIKDLVGMIHWKDAPFTRASVTSDTKSVTPDGVVQITPALTGIEGNDKKYKQRLKPQGNITGRYMHQNYDTSWLFQAKHYPQLTLFGLGVEKPILQGHTSVVLWPEAKTIEATYKHRRFSFSLGLDNIDLSKANSLWFSVGIN